MNFQQKQKRVVSEWNFRPAICWSLLVLVITLYQRTVSNCASHHSNNDQSRPLAEVFNSGSHQTFLNIDFIHSCVPSTRPLRSSSSSRLVISLCLLLSGDVESPGPRKPRFPCGMCSRAVKNTDPAVCCDHCDMWIHNKCSGLSSHIYESMKDSSGVWICPSCGLPSFASSLFDSSSSTTTYNSFSALDHSSVRISDTTGPASVSTPYRSVHRTNSPTLHQIKVVSTNINSLRGKSLQILEMIHSD